MRWKVDFYPSKSNSQIILVVYSNRLSVKSFFDSMKVTSTEGKEPPFTTTKKESKKYAAREEWKKLIAQVWRRTK